MYYNEFKSFKIEQKEHALVARLNNPPVNAINENVFKELQDIIELANSDQNIISIIIASDHPKLFTVGADVKELVKRYGRKPEKAIINLNIGHLTYNLIEDSPKPIIIAMKGISYGGGIELACACDIRIASEDAKFAMPETRIGFIPGYGGTQRLPRLVGYGNAKKLIFSGEPIDAQNALKIGLIDEITLIGKEIDRAIEIAESISKGAPKSIAIVKQSINKGMNLFLEDALEQEKDFFMKNVETKAWMEGLYGFIQKRPPKFERIGKKILNIKNV